MGNTNHYASGQWRALSADGTAVQAEEIGVWTDLLECDRGKALVLTTSLLFFSGSERLLCTRDGRWSGGRWIRPLI